MAASWRSEPGSAAVAVAGILDRRGVEGAHIDRLKAAVGDASRPGTVLRLDALTVAVSDGVAIHDHGRFVCCLLGTLLNAPALTARLGLPSETSPAAAIAAAYECDGTAVLDGLRGSFLLVLWDRRARTGLLAQDQLAARAWFLHSAGAALTFASEIPPLLDALATRPAPDVTGVVRWLTSRALPDGVTPYGNVRRLQVGQAVAVSQDDWRPFTAWAPVYRSPAPVERGEAAELVRDGVRRAVDARLSPDGRTAILLSGGFDSGTLAGVAAPLQRERGELLPAYSSVFPGEPYDESPSIETLTSELDLPSTRLRIHPQGSLTRALRFQRRWEMPQPAPGSITDQPLIQHAAADGATVIFDGQGGDELFSYSPFLIADHLVRLRLLAAYRLCSRYPGVGSKLELRHVRVILKRWGGRAALPYGLHRRLIERRRNEAGGRPEAAWLSDAALHAYEPVDLWAWKREFDGPRWWAYHASALTTARDQSGMQDFLRRRAQLDGLESRSPLMADVDLVELMLRLPPELAFDPNVDRALARESMRGIVPEAVRVPAPAKSDYSSFMHRTLAGADLDGFRRLLLNPRAEVRAFTRPDALADHFGRVPTASDRDWATWGHRTWALATTELWLQAQHGVEQLARATDGLGLPEPSTEVVAAWRS